MKPSLSVVTETKPHISVSQFSTFVKCGIMFKFIYRDGLKVPPGIALPKGGGYHEAAEYNARQKVDSREDRPVDEIIEVAVAGFERRVEHEGVLLDPEDEARGKSIVLGEAKDSTARLAAVYARQIAPRYQPVIVEERQRVPVDDGPRDLIVVPDFVDENDVIVDLKTAAKSKVADEADKSLQLTAQFMGHLDVHERVAKQLRLEVAIDTGNKQYVQTLETTRSLDDVQPFLDRIKLAAEAIEKEAFVPTDPSNWWCSARWCGYARTGLCPFFKGKR